MDGTTALVQETFLKAWRVPTRTDPDDLLAFRPWLYRIAMNTARSWQRRQKLRSWLPIRVDRDDEPSHDPALADVLGVREAGGDALLRIGADARSIVLLRHYQQLTVDEIAEALGTNPNTAKVRLHQARMAFAAAYTGHTNDFITSSAMPSQDAQR